MAMKLATFDAFKHISSEKCLELDDEQLKELQDVLLGILIDIAEVCERHGIIYSVCGGTALGAIRHKGFIPWDDDVDIFMSRKEYERFVPIFLQEKGERYWVHTPEKTKDYTLLLAKIRLKGTSVKSRDDFRNEECGAFIDLFIVENTFDQKILRNIHGFGCMATGFLLSCRKFYRDRRELLEIAEGNRKAFQTKINIGFFLSFASVDWWRKRTVHWYSLCKNEHSKYVFVAGGRKHFWGELFEREDVCESVYTEFLPEPGEIQIMKNWEKYLRRLYGNYMEIPKDADKEKHVFFHPFDLVGGNEL